MKFVVLFLFFFAAVAANAQKEATNWYFGLKAGITFRNGTPVALLDGQTAASEGTAVISDKNTGDLLFYTDGITVWNREHGVMENGTGLYGGSSSTQSALIIPHPSDGNLYYIFTNTGDMARIDPEPALWYSVVDMRLDGGRGAVIVKNTKLIDSVSEKTDATLHCNNRDICTG